MIAYNYNKELTLFDGGLFVKRQTIIVVMKVTFANTDDLVTCHGNLVTGNNNNLKLNNLLILINLLNLLIKDHICIVLLDFSKETVKFYTTMCNSC